MISKLKCKSRFPKNLITSEGASSLFSILNKFALQLLFKINLNSNFLDDDCMEILGEFLKSKNTIEDLDIGFNNITDKGIEKLAVHLIGNTKLLSLDISGNKGITDKSFLLLKELAEKSQIVNINMAATTISFRYIVEIDFLLRNPIEQREIPIYSQSKSAKKNSLSIQEDTS